jgi:hypothetical protein
MPCVCLHAAFNASVVAYFESNNRTSNIGCYFAETATILAVSLALFVIANKRAFSLTAPEGEIT